MPSSLHFWRARRPILAPKNVPLQHETRPEWRGDVMRNRRVCLSPERKLLSVALSAEKFSRRSPCVPLSPRCSSVAPSHRVSGYFSFKQRAIILVRGRGGGLLFSSDLLHVSDACSGWEIVHSLFCSSVADACQSRAVRLGASCQLASLPSCFLQKK